MPNDSNIMSDSPESAADLLTLLREQASLYMRLESFAARQRGLVLGEDPGPLLAMLAERGRLSQQLAEVGSRLAPIRKDWTSHRERLSSEQRVEAERLLHEAGVRLQRVIESDEQDVRVLSGRKQAVAESLSKTHVTSRAIHAYRVADGGTKRLDCITQEM